MALSSEPGYFSSDSMEKPTSLYGSRAAGVAVLLLTLLSVPALASAAASVQKANIAHATLSARLAPLWIAQEQGFFLKNGIHAEVVLVRSGAALIAGIASGDIHLGSIGAGTALGAAASGMDLSIIANFTSKASVELVARPGIKSAEDLKGKRFGIQSHGGTLWLYTMMTLEHFGLDTARDRIQLQVVGDVSVLARALEAGTIDATVLSSAVYSRPLRDKGFPHPRGTQAADCRTGDYRQKNIGATIARVRREHAQSTDRGVGVRAQPTQ